MNKIALGSAQFGMNYGIKNSSKVPTNEEIKKILDLNRSESFILSCLAAPILFFGFYPDPLINTIEVSVTDLINMHNTNIASK